MFLVVKSGRGLHTDLYDVEPSNRNQLPPCCWYANFGQWVRWMVVINRIRCNKSRLQSLGLYLPKKVQSGFYPFYPILKIDLALFVLVTNDEYFPAKRKKSLDS